MKRPSVPLATQLSLLGMFARAELRRRYVGTFIGLTWVVAYPIIYIAVYVLVFDRMIHVSFDGPSYGVFLAAGLIPWIAFQEAVTSSPRIFFERIQIVKRSTFPTHLLPLARTLASSAVFVVTLAALILIGRRFSPALVALVPLLALHFLFVAGLALALAYTNVFIRDIEHLVGILILGVMFLTPVFYSPSIFPPWLKGAAALNPFAIFIGAYRQIIVFGRFPASTEWLGIIVYGAASVAIGTVSARRLGPRIGDHA